LNWVLIKYRIRLTPPEREQLLNILRKKPCAAARQSHARILLKADEAVAHGGLLDADIAVAIEVSVATVERVRRRFVEEGMAAALERKAPERTYVRRLDGIAEAKLIALTCGEAPSGCARWTLRLLADRLVELEVVASVCHETVRQTLRANDLKPWLKRQWCIAPTASADFVCRMEDVLEVYHRPFDPQRPVVCLDETTKQLVSETRTPLPAAAGRPVSHDYEYERQGVASLFMLCAPLHGWREVSVRERKTRVDYAQCLRALAEEHFPQAEKIVLVQDNLNTHAAASLYEAFEPVTARRLLERFEFHYTPKHGSWLNIAEIELSVLNRQCLARRIGDWNRLRQEVTAWTARRNQPQCKINWRFTTADARIKLKKLYPSFED
jgi:transposase